ncbi:MAG: F510_1955 family glycosylhydrolase [Sporichthyaceae bacterium]
MSATAKTQAPQGPPQVHEPAPPHGGRVVVAVVLALLVTLTVGTFVYAGTGGGSHPDAHTPTSSVAMPELGFGHVHGLGVDPADGVLYAASHYGVFRLAPGAEPVRVAGRFQDTMAFTVAGPGTFLASGHPDLGEDLPVRLGLIESTDAAQTWRILSLGGAADFHVLRVAHGRLYGYDSTSGTLLVSQDRRRWETRGVVELRDFVVDPADPDVLLATAEDRLLRSGDGGRTWQSRGGAPALRLLDWSAGRGLYGIGPDGALRHSADGGATWTERGQTGGAPQAMSVAAGGDDGERIYVAVESRGVLASGDGGRRFDLAHEAKP